MPDMRKRAPQFVLVGARAVLPVQGDLVRSDPYQGDAMTPSVPLSQAHDLCAQIAALRAEVGRLRIAHDRADGALADAETVPAGNLDLTDQRAAARTRYVLANAGWKEMDRQLLAAEADVRALAGALYEVAEACEVIARDPVCSIGEGRAWRAVGRIANAALARPGVVRVREEGES